MIGPGRLALRRAKAAARAGRYTEALELLQSGPAAEYRQAAELRAAIAGKLARRAAEQLERGWSAAALRDWRHAQRAGAGPELLGEVRGKLLARAEQELRRYLDAGDPQAAAELAAKLAREGLESDRLRELARAARLWLESQAAARAGSFADAERLLQAAAALASHCTALQRWREQMQAGRKQFEELSSRMYERLEAGDWAAVVKCAAELANVSPDWPPGREARELAWQRLKPSAGQLHSLRRLIERQGRSAAHWASQTCELASGHCDAEQPAERSLVLWVDGAGGYLLCLADMIWLGQAVPGNRVEVPILADISRRHAVLCRDAEGYVLAADRRIAVNGRPVQRAAIGDGDRIKLGDSVELTVSVPCPASATAVLRISSGHRLPLSLEGIVLMAQSCLIGPTGQSHIVVPDVAGSATLYRDGGWLACRASEPIWLGGRPAGSDRVRIECGVPVQVAGISFCCERAADALRQA